MIFTSLDGLDVAVYYTSSGYLCLSRPVLSCPVASRLRCFFLSLDGFSDRIGSDRIGSNWTGLDGII